MYVEMLTSERIESFRKSLPDRCSLEPNSGCWLWTGGVNNKGYPMVWLTEVGQNVLAHKLSFEVFKGSNIAWTLHRCDTPSCINPNHLFAGNRSDNMRDCVAKGRATQTYKPGHPGRRGITLDQLTVAALRACWLEGFSTRKTAERCGVCRGTVVKLFKLFLQKSASV